MSLFLLLLLSTLLTAISAVPICPVGCTCNDDTLVVICEKSRLEVVPITLNPSNQRLVLRNNKIKTIDAAFHFYGELTYVDLSYNHLVHIPPNSFDMQKKLQELHLNKNRISSINNRTFQGLSKLTVLNLRENILEELTRGLFSVMVSLEELNLGQNRITKIDPLAFEGLNSLRVLYLDDNMLSAIPTPSFAVLGGLAELHVGLNVFNSLPDHAFQGLSKLLVLDVASAALNNISENAFSGLTSLRNLNLNDNRLTATPTQQLLKLSRLEELFLGQNDFSSLEPDSFKGLANLKKLDITGASHLQIIKKGAFAENTNLETLILNSNRKLDAVEEGALTGLPKLRHLSLKENAFRSFSESMVPWGELHVLDLSDNPLHCGCQVLWLSILLGERNTSAVTCMTPAALKDRPLKTVAGDELGCTLHDPRQRALLGALCISAALLVACLAILLYRYRLRVSEALKEYKWNKRAISRKEHEYQKTFAASDDEYIMRAAHAQLKPIPVTEL